MEKLLKNYIIEELENKKLYLIEDDIDDIIFAMEKLGVEMTVSNFKILLNLATNIK